MSVGDPCGIGPEVAVKALASFLSKNKSTFVVCFAALRSLSNQSQYSRLRPHFKSGRLVVVDPSRNSPPPRKAGKHSAQLALDCLTMATDFCLSGLSKTLVTGPVDKSLCAKIIPGFSGHTEFLRDRCRVSGTTMLLASDNLTVALVTTHIALKNVSKALSEEKIVSTAARTMDFLSFFSRRPRLAICALNPHASDHGLFGDEEARTILPAIRKLKRHYGRAAISGPHPADTVFHRSKEFDAIICQYHDQGLIPIKTAAFYEAVNITLGLPFLRTSVDHGTAFDIAGKDRASYISFLRALEYANRWQKSRHSGSRRQRA